METDALSNSARAHNAEEVLTWLRDDLNASGNSDFGGFGKVTVPAFGSEALPVLPEMGDLPATSMDTSGNLNGSGDISLGISGGRFPTDVASLRSQLYNSGSYENAVSIQAEIDRLEQQEQAHILPKQESLDALSVPQLTAVPETIAAPNLVDVQMMNGDSQSKHSTPQDEDESPPHEAQGGKGKAPGASDGSGPPAKPTRKSSAKRLMRSRISQQKWRTRKRQELEELQARSARLTELERIMVDKEDELRHLRQENKVLHAMIAAENSSAGGEAGASGGASGTDADAVTALVQGLGIISAPAADDVLETEYMNLIELISRSLHARAVSDVIVPMVQRAFGLSVQLLSRAGPLAYPIQDLTRQQHAEYWRAVGDAMDMTPVQLQQVALFREARAQAIQDTHDERFRLYTTLRSLVLCGPPAMSPASSQLYALLGICDQLRANLLKEQHSRLIFCQALLQNMNPLQAAQLLIAQFPDHAAEAQASRSSGGAPQGGDAAGTQQFLRSQAGSTPAGQPDTTMRQAQSPE